jgi:uncharacterized membrane protein
MSHPSHDEPVVRGASTAIGGPVGRHARAGRHWFWTPLRITLVLTMLTVVVGFAQKAPCRDGQFGDGNFYAYSRLCYTDVYALYFAERLNEGKTPYVDWPVEYPVVIGGFMGAASGITNTTDDVLDDTRLGPISRPGRYYDISAVMLGICALVMTATSLVLAGRRRPWDAALVAVAPGLMMHATTNWDLIAAALAGVGLVLWSRRHPVAAGVLLGLAVSTKLYPAMFFFPLLVLCLRARRVKEWALAAGSAFVTIVLVNLPVILAAGHFKTNADGAFITNDEGSFVEVARGTPDSANAWLRFIRGNQERPADWDSLHYMVERMMQRITRNDGWRFPVRGADLEPVRVGGVELSGNVRALAAAIVIGALFTLVALTWRSERPRQAAAAATAAVALVAGFVVDPYVGITVGVVLGVGLAVVGIAQGRVNPAASGVATAVAGAILLLVQLDDVRVELGRLVSLNRLVAVGTLGVLCLVCLLAWKAPRRPRVGQVLFLVIAGFLLANKVNSPQFTIWLIPLAVMARPRWGAFLVWQVSELLVVFTRFYFFINLSQGPSGLPVEWFLSAVLIRDAALVALMGLVVREMFRPHTDAVRDAGVDDPAGGVLDGAPERPPRYVPAGVLSTV